MESRLARSAHAGMVQELHLRSPWADPDFRSVTFLLCQPSVDMLWAGGVSCFPAH